LQEVSANIIQNSDVGNYSPKTEGAKTKATRCLFFLMSLHFLHILNSLQSSLLFTIAKFVSKYVKETTEMETGMAEKPSRDQANIRQKRKN
jgi:hypothetical protein